MISLPAQVRVFLCTKPTDMRKGFDGLSGLVTQVFQADGLSGDLFLFFNRRRDRIKILLWDRDGFVIWYKRLEQGTYQIPEARDDGCELTANQLALLLGGIDLNSAKERKRYKRAG